jgi:hypothetical protein
MIEAPNIGVVILFALLEVAFKTAWYIFVIAAGIVVSRFVKWGNH